MTTPGHGRLTPFDLQAPARLLTPATAHQHRSEIRREVRLGDGDAAPVLYVTTWNGCALACRGIGEHQRGIQQWIRLRWPCGDRTHCSSCECLPWHEVTLTPDMVAAVKAALP